MHTHQHACLRAAKYDGLNLRYPSVCRIYACMRGRGARAHERTHAHARTHTQTHQHQQHTQHHTHTHPHIPHNLSISHPGGIPILDIRTNTIKKHIVYTSYQHNDVNNHPTWMVHNYNVTDLENDFLFQERTLTF